MGCKHLVYGWRWKEADPVTGKKGIIKKNKHANPGFLTEPAVRPCGGCIDCRLNYSRQWAIRCMHESKSHENNCVITLTYAPKYKPQNNSIVPSHAVKFMERLRNYAAYNENHRGIKTYGCAEYGEINKRPHYHIILFNYTFKDAKPYGDKPGYYTSDILEQTWGLGELERTGHYSTQIMDLTFDSAAYVARYIMKKMTGKQAENYGDRLPEQTICISQKGIGKEWYQKNKHKIYTNDLLYINGQAVRPTKYYDKQYELDEPTKYKQLKIKRQIETEKTIQKTNEEIKQGDNANNWNNLARQRAHERCMEAKLELLKRTVE